MKRIWLFGLMAAMVAVAGFANTAFSACKAGDKGEVLWKGSWYPATAIKAKGDKCYIHYDGYGKNWDEWVGPNRMRMKDGGTTAVAPGTKNFSEGDAVQVLWKGRWYPAHVIGVGKGKWRIHYDGYDNSWDEWVASGRIRK